MPSREDCGCTSAAKPCRWCWRARDHPNPLNRDTGEHLKFVTNQNLCQVCRFVLTLAYGGEDKQKLYASVSGDPHPRREEFLKAVSAWEEAHSQNPTGNVRYKDFRSVFDSKLEAVQTDSLQVEEVLGHLWPVATYEGYFKKTAPPRNKLTSVVHKGQQVLGVLVDPTKGWAPGVLKVSQNTTAALASTTDLGRKSEELRPNQLADLRKQQLAEMRQESIADPDCGDEGLLSMKRKATTVQLHADMSDDEDACFAARFVPRLAGSAGCAAKAGDQSSCTKPKGLGSRISSEAQAVKHEQEMNAVKVVLLEASQYMAMLNKAGFALDSSVVSKGKTITKRLEARLAQKNKEILLASEGDEAMSNISRMNLMLRQVETVVRLATVLCVQKGDDTSVDALRIAMTECLENGSYIPDSVRTELLWREMSARLSSGKVGEISDIIRDGCKQCHSADFVGDKARARFDAAQSSAISGALTMSFKACGNKRGAASLEMDEEPLQRLANLVDALAKAFSAETPMGSALEMLRKVLQPDKLDESVFADLPATLKALREDSSLALHPVFAAWGSSVFDRCDQWRAALTRDKTLLVNFQRGLTEVKVTVAALRKSLETCAVAATTYSSVITSCSERFKSVHKEKIADFKRSMLTCAEVVEKLFAKRFAQTITPTLTVVVDVSIGKKPIKAETVAPLAEALDAASLTQCLNFFDKLSLNAVVVDEEDRVRLQAMREVRSSFRSAWKAVVEELGGSSDKEWRCIHSKGIQAIASQYFVPGNLDKNWVALCGAGDGEYKKKLSAVMDAFKEGVVKCGVELTKVIVTKHNLKGFMLSVSRAKEMDMAHFMRVWEAESSKIDNFEALQGRLKDMEADFEGIMPIHSVFSGIFPPGEVVKFTAVKDHCPLQLCERANRIAGVAAATGMLLQHPLPNQPAEFTAEHTTPLVWLFKGAKQAMSSLMMRLPAKGAQDQSSGNGDRLKVLDEATKQLQKKGEIVMKDCNTALVTKLDELAALACKPEVDISSIMDRAETLTPQQLETIKGMWRSSDAKALFQADSAYMALKSSFSDLAGCDLDCPAAVAAVEKHHEEKYPQVLKVLGVCGLAQAAYKSLKAHENRADIILGTLESLRENKVKLPEGVLAQAQRVVG